MAFELNDDQQLAATALDRNVLVTAGAGSGKTRMLTQRFINAVVPGRVEGWKPADVDEVVAITFTEKAAGELAERVRLELRGEGLSDAARRVDSAWVSTIHGMCSRLLRRHAFEAGVDPLFTVADTVAAGTVRAATFESVAARLIASDDDVAGLFDAYAYEKVHSAVSLLAGELATRGIGFADIEIEPAASVPTLLDEAQAAFEADACGCQAYAGSADTPAKHAAACVDWAGRVQALRAEPEEVALTRLSELVSEYKPLRANIKGVEHVTLEGRERMTSLQGKITATMVAPHARGLIRLAERFAAEFSAAKRRAGLLDFDDLQVGAAELLEREPALARRYAERFRLVMIDEFQDTDALQLRLVSALSDGNLCTVGDEKQSIYRFRGADIEVYRQHRADMLAARAIPVPLGVNYRSHPEVLAFVNAVFSSEQYFDGDLLRLTSPEGGRAEQPIDAVLGESPRVEVLFVDCNQVSGSDGRRAEAAGIAARLAALHASGVDPGDMVILVRRYSHAHVYSEALARAGVPAVIVGGRRFFGLAETTVMRALTRAIANPADGSAVGELLASEFCPISDDGLARLRLLGQDEERRAPLWSVLCAGANGLGGDDREAALRLVHIIEQARAEIGTRPLSDILLIAVEVAGYDLRLLSRGNEGRDAFANVLKFARQAAAFEATEGTGPAGFSAYIDQKELLGDSEAPASVADDGSHAVRIMSVHASKGLEFPVVVVVDLASSGNGDRGIVRIAPSGSGVRLALSSPPTDAGIKLAPSTWAAEFDEAEKRGDAEETNRILYVAFTRARDALLVSGSMNLRTKNPSTATHHLNRLAGLLGVSTPIDGFGVWERTLRDRDTGQIARARVTVVDALDVPDAAAEEIDPDAEPCAPAPDAGALIVGRTVRDGGLDRVSYSTLRTFEQCPRRYFASHVLGLARIEELAGTAEDDPVRFGSALHAVLQLVDDRGRLPAAERVAAIVRQYELSDAMATRLGSAAARYTGSAVAARVVLAESVARETSFALPVAGGSTLLAGAIDLYARSGTSALIVDYKSGVSGDSPELLDRYRLQAECYALVALLDGCDTVEVVFVRPEVADAAGEPEQVVFTFDSRDAERLRGEIDGRCEQVVASEYEPLAGRDERVCRGCPAPVGLCPNARS